MRVETHGGLNLSELRSAGIDPASLIDFSVNVNPFGPSPQALSALRTLDPASYPDRHSLDLSEKLANLNSMAPENVLTGNGTTELIWLIAQAFLKPGDPAMIVGPTFGEYERAARALGANVIHVSAVPPDFELAVNWLLAEIKSCHPRLVFLCNPNNPTGRHLPEAVVTQLAAACAEGLLILDEAYRSFIAPSPFGPPLASNILIVRSLTKDFALAGLRLGYALGEADLIAAMRAFQPFWSVNSPAQAVGLACLNDLDYLRRTLELTRQSANGLQTALAALGARVLPMPTTPFCLVNVSDSARWRQQLLAEGCLVRDCASFDLPQYVRVSARRPEENEKLIHAWAKLSAQAGQ